MFTRVIVVNDGKSNVDRMFELGKKIILNSTLPTNYNSVERTIVGSFDEAYRRILDDVNEGDSDLKIRGTIVMHSDSFPPQSIKAFNQRLYDAQMRSKKPQFYERVVVMPIGENFEAYKNDDLNRYLEAYAAKKSRAKAAGALIALALYEDDFYRRTQGKTADEIAAIAREYGLNLAGLGAVQGEQGQATYLEDGLPTNPDALEDLEGEFDKADQKDYTLLKIGAAVAAVGLIAWYVSNRRKYDR
jgi:hypothetical protein